MSAGVGPSVASEDEQGDEVVREDSSRLSGFPRCLRGPAAPAPSGPRRYELSLHDLDTGTVVLEKFRNSYLSLQTFVNILVEMFDSENRKVRSCAIS